MSVWKKIQNAATGKGKWGWMNPTAKLARYVRDKTGITKRLHAFNRQRRGINSASSLASADVYGSTGSIVGRY